MARLAAGHLDQYEPGTRRERGYMCGITSVYKDDCIEDAATVAATVLQESTIDATADRTANRVSNISGVEVYTQDAEWDLSDTEFD